MSIFSCRDTVRLASESLDRDLLLRQRVALHFHKLMCPQCSRFHGHLLVLRDAARRLAEQVALDDAGPVSLSPAARDRIECALEQANS